ncbi:MAG: hypothetical protein MUF19_02420 [Candidatus Pacebacteria bacterium]|jgi:hypothetical protein|nr:hypothetical protein [Candidatus Paceibacterota bacterium]
MSPEETLSGKAILESAQVLADSRLQPSEVAELIASYREGNVNPSVDAQVLAAVELLSQTSMSEFEATAVVVVKREGYDSGNKPKFAQPAGLLGAALSDFAFDRRTKTIVMVPYPSDIVHFDPFRALAIALWLGYKKGPGGIWVEEFPNL